jgi:hypothetical protein
MFPAKGDTVEIIWDKASARSLVRLDQEHAFERVDETNRRPKHVHPKYQLSLRARGTVRRRVDVGAEGERDA